MLSPLAHYKRVPRERSANLRFRRYVLSRCRKDTRFRKAVLEACRRDVVFFVNVFVWQFNPNWVGTWSSKFGPFVTAAFQDDAMKTILECIQERCDCVIEKSREMGASWLCLIVILWMFLFHPGSIFLCVSRNADAVDDGTSDCLFWKLDYILDRLPEWMTPTISRRKFSFHNESNLSQISGQASTGKAGVGGRATAILVDEFSQIKEDWEVLDRTVNTSGCRIFSGTHLGTNTAFYDLTVKAEKARYLKKILMHWTLHPDKCRGLYRYDHQAQRVEYLDPGYRYAEDFAPVTDGSPSGGPMPGVRSPWYDKKCEGFSNNRGIAADLDINPSGSVEQVFDPVLIKNLVTSFCREPWEADLEWDRLSAEPVRLHTQAGGRVKLWTRLDYDGKPAKARYVCGNDVATGTGATPSCCSIVNAQTGEKVAEYVDSHIEPKEFAYLVVALCRLFADEDGRGAKLAWEVPGPGITFGKHVMELGYRNLYLRVTEHRLKKEESDTPGWANNPESMKHLIDNYKDALRSKQFLNRSEFSLTECLAFMYAADGYVYHTGWKDPKDPSGARINHGDRVVADAMCWKMADEMGRLVKPEDRGLTPAEKYLRPNTLEWRRRVARMDGDANDDWSS